MVNNIPKVYAIGYYTQREGVKTFYIDETTLDCSALVLKCLDSLLCRKYHDFTFYVHSFGRYDVFILKNLKEIKALYSRSLNRIL